MADSKMITGAEAQLRKARSAAERCFASGPKKRSTRSRSSDSNCFEQGRTKEAEAIFQGLIALNSRLYHGYAGMGALALVAQSSTNGGTWLSEAAERNPNDPPSAQIWAKRCCGWADSTRQPPSLTKHSRSTPTRKTREPTAHGLSCPR